MRFAGIPPDVWQNIFLFVVLDNSQTSGTLPLTLVDRWMHSVLCACRPENAHLYATIFLYYFNIEAPRRRFGITFMTSFCLSAELRERLACLHRIRRREHPSLPLDILTDDLCRCYLMLLESDDKNAKLLLDYAELSGFILDLAQKYICHGSLVSEQVSPPPFLFFLLWLLWLISSQSVLLAEEQEIADDIQGRLMPYVISAWRYQDYPPSIMPLSDNYSHPWKGVVSKSSYTTNFFGRRISLRLPLISPAAILSFCPRADACFLRYARGSHASNFYSEDAIAWANRLLTASVAGLYPRLERNSEPADAPLVDDVFSTPSERFDDDWARLEIQFAHPDPPSPLSSISLTIDLRRLLALISGIWDGRMEYPDYSEYMALRHARNPPLESFNELFISSVPLSCHLQIYYCTRPEDVLRMSGEEDRDGILNAWMPSDEEIEITHAPNEELRIWDRVTKTIASYRLYDSHRDLLDPSEIKDIIIFGTSISPNPGLAAQYIGRVRRSDGLIVMTRDGPQLGRELLRGYIHHGRNFVGRWRTTALPADAHGWEGPVIMARREACAHA
ncbi:hypothetical protein K439DRAFT_369871 [Ramaria rubella]|nr:hypothetical protein K439DRAFT_369871 [Ramaria rubella]